MGFRKKSRHIYNRRPDNKINEQDKTNNNANKEYTGTLKYYILADVLPFISSFEIENYIKENLKDGVVVYDPNEADIKIFITGYDSTNSEAIDKEGWGFYGGVLKFQDKICSKPYCGIVGDLDKNGKKVTFKGTGRHDACVLPRAVPIDYSKEIETYRNAIKFIRSAA